MATSDLGELLLSASLAFLALLPAALSVMTNYYHTQRINGIVARDLSSTRVAIHLMSGAMLLVLVVYFSSLQMVIHSPTLWPISLGDWFTPANIAISGMSLAVVFITFGLLRFIQRFFVKVDGEYTPLSDLRQ